MNDEAQDRLIDLLLLEEVGNRKPPDLRERVLAAAGRRRPWRAVVPAAAAAAAAALVLVALAVWRATPPQAYPAAQVGPGVSVAGGRAVRGAELSTAGQGGEVVLGGYCRLRMGPGTLLRLEGGPKAESVHLLRGELLCDVDSSIGEFTVRTDRASASVHGTKFSVTVLEKQGDEQMSGKMLVKVMVGAVLVATAAGTQMVTSGEERVASDAGVAPASGTMTGIVVEKGKDAIVIKDEAGTRERFVPQWVGGLPASGGGYDKTMLAAIAERKVGDKVEITWVFNERKRITAIKLLVASTQPAETRPATSKPVEPAVKEGTATGIIIDKGADFIRLKFADGKTETYRPQWVGGLPKDGGGFDKNILGAIAERKVGDKVEIIWVWSERYRVTAIRLIEAAGAETPK
jgi:hypothetical protein